MYSTNGKEVLRDNRHFGDADNHADAEAIAGALNIIETKPASFDYVAEAKRTLSNKFHGELVSRNLLIETINNCTGSLHALDLIKKALFYGRDTGLSVAYGGRNDAFTIIPDVDPASYVAAENIIHGVIGVATEAGELLEALVESFEGFGPIDKVNIKEEVGDLFWYLAILADACGFTFDEAQRTNIAKLRARFPNAFTEHDANNRNLEVERNILETRPADHLNVP